MENQQASLNNSENSTFSNERLETLLSQLQGTVRHDDVFPTSSLSCNITWIETFLITLNHQENTMYRCQQVHFEIANVLTEWMERRIQIKREM